MYFIVEGGGNSDLREDWCGTVVKSWRRLVDDKKQLY